MSREIFNIDALVKVEIHDKKRCYYFTHQPYKKYWLYTQKETFWFSLNSGYTREYLMNEGVEGIKFIVEGNQVYYRPYVKLIFAGKATKVITFDTYEAAKQYGEKQADLNMKAQLVFD